MRPFLLLLAFFAVPAFAAVHGQDLLSGQETEVKSGTKGTALVFLSAKCPCSNSHVEILKSLAKDYPDFTFAAVHANADETSALSKKYFAEAKLPFPVIEDGGGKLANEFKALKTPHAFLLSPEGKVLYRGGVTNSNNGPGADKQYLRDALADVQAGRAVKTESGRTLGCVIARE